MCISCSAVIHEVVVSDSSCQTQTDIDSHHCLPFDSQHQSDILKEHSESKNSWAEVSAKFAFYFMLVAILKKAHLKYQGDSNLEVVAVAEKKKLVDDVASKKHSILVQAIQSGDLEHCGKAVQDGCSLRFVDAWGCTALHVACQNGTTHVVQWLLSQDVSIDAVDSWDETPLHLAARNGHVQVCEHLIAHGASIHAVNAHNQNPLLVAVLAGQEFVCRLLRSRGGFAKEMDSIPLEFQSWVVAMQLSGTDDEELSSD